MARSFSKLVVALIVAVAGCGIAAAQSTEQNRPTPIISNEIAGVVEPRPIGDSRLTTYYFIFTGNQGDTFINVKTNNFSGDIDIFYADTLLPIAKIVLFADLGESETGRVIYLRKTENLMLRMQGRTPNDDKATYQIKFAGSFAPSTAKIDDTPLPTVPVAIKPPEPAVAKNETDEKPERSDPPREDRSSEIPRVIVEDPLAKKSEEVEAKPAKETVAERRRRNDESRKQRAAEAAERRKAGAEKRAAIAAEKRAENEAARMAADTKKPEPAVDPLASIYLIVELRSGETFKRPMTEILRFNVDKGILTITTKDGKIIRHSLVDVAKTSIE